MLSPTSPTKEKGPFIGGKKLTAIQNLLHHRPRSHSWSHREKEKHDKGIISVYILEHISVLCYIETCPQYKQTTSFRINLP